MNQQEISVRILKALGHPIRYKIVKFLYEGPKCVCKLNENIEFSQANLSQHLRILREAGLLTCEKVGMETHYRICCDEVKHIIDYAEQCAKSCSNNSK